MAQSAPSDANGRGVAQHNEGSGKRLPRRRVFYHSKPSANKLVNDGFVREIVDQFERLNDWQVRYDASDLRGGQPHGLEVPLGDEEDSDDLEAEEIGVDNTFYVGPRTITGRETRVGRATHMEIVPEDSTFAEILHPTLEEEEEDEYVPLRQPSLYPNGPPASGEAEAKFWLNSKEASYLSDDDDDLSDQDDTPSNDDASSESDFHSPRPTSPSASFSFNLDNRRLADASRGKVASPKPEPPKAVSKRRHHALSSPRAKAALPASEMTAARGKVAPPAPEAAAARARASQLARTPTLVPAPAPPPPGPPQAPGPPPPPGPTLSRQVTGHPASPQAPRATSEMTATASSAHPGMAPRQQSAVTGEWQNGYYFPTTPEGGRRMPVVNGDSTSTVGVRGKHPQLSGTRPAESAALRVPLYEAASERDGQRKAMAAAALGTEHEKPSLVRRLRNRRARGRREAKAPQPHIVHVKASANAVEPSRPGA